MIFKRRSGARDNKYGLCGQWSCRHNHESMCQLFPDKKVSFCPECPFFEVKR